MFCGNCGQKNADSSRFCEKCGSPLVTVAPPVSNGDVFASGSSMPQGRPTLISTMRKPVTPVTPEPTTEPVVSQPEPAPIGDLFVSEPVEESTTEPIVSQPEPAPIGDLFVSEPVEEPSSEPIVPQPEPAPIGDLFVSKPVEEPTTESVVSQPEIAPIGDLFVSEPVEESAPAPEIPKTEVSPFEELFTNEPVAEPAITETETSPFADLFTNEPASETISESVVPQPDFAAVSDLFVSEPVADASSEPIISKPETTPVADLFASKSVTEAEVSVPAFDIPDGTKKPKKKTKKTTSDKKPMSKKSKLIMVISAVLVIALIGVVLYFNSSGDETPSAKTPEDAFTQYMESRSKGDFDKYISFAPDAVNKYLKENKACYDLIKAQFNYDYSNVVDFKYEIDGIVEADRYTANDVERHINSVLRMVDENASEIRVEQAMKVSYNLEIKNKQNVSDVYEDGIECLLYRLENSEKWYVMGVEDPVEEFVW